MRSLDQPKVVDAVLLDQALGVYRLLIMMDEAWDGSRGQLLRLQEKLNHLMAYALDGPMETHYPGAQGKDVILRLVCLGPPPPQALAMLERARVAVDGHGLALEWAVAGA